MSANIPFDIQVEIIKNILPVKSLIRFRSVSKQWKSLIDDSEFINHHSLSQIHPHHLLLRYKEASEHKYVSIVDDDSFPEHKIFHTVKQFGMMLGSSHGLVCLKFSTGDAKNRMNQIVVWNPSIRKFVHVPLPGVFQALRFGVCPKTGDPKIVNITRNTFSMGWKAEVFRLSSMAWSNVPINLLDTLIVFSYSQAVVDGVIYWIGYTYMCHVYQIISFDLTSEEFEEIELPECIAHSQYVNISKLKESVVVVNHSTGHVWMMLKNDVSKFSFSKLFTFKSTIGIIGFRKNGQLIMTHDDVLDKELKVYEPCSECYTRLGIYGSSLSMTSYTESLLLLNHPDSIIEC